MLTISKEFELNNGRMGRSERAYKQPRKKELKMRNEEQTDCMNANKQKDRGKRIERERERQMKET